MTKNEREDQLYDEKFDIEYELFFKLRTLINASWDSNTLKIKIKELLEQWEKVEDELIELHETLHPDHHSI